MTELSVTEAVRLAFEWARENHLTPLNTVITVGGIACVFFLASMSRGAKRIVRDVHSVYAQALEDQKRAAQALRAENEKLAAARAVLLDDLERERVVKEEALRAVARLREKAAKKGDSL